MDQDSGGSGEQKQAVQAESDTRSRVEVEHSAFDAAHEQGGGNGGGGNTPTDQGPAKKFLQRLTLNEWLTFLVGTASLAVAALGLVNAINAQDIKKAVSDISALAAQTKRQADDSDKQIGALATQFAEMQKQTGALRDTAQAAQGQLVRADEANQIATSALQASQKAMQAQLDAMKNAARDSDRAWVFADFASGGINLDKSPAAEFVFTYRITNTGHTPATHVAVQFDIDPYLYPPFVQTVSTYALMVHACQSADILATQEQAGYVLFPGGVVPTGTQFGMSDITRAGGLSLPRGIQKNPEELAIVVGACVSYNIGQDDTAHHTAAVFKIVRADGKPIFLSDGSVKGSDLRLILLPVARQPD